MKLMLNRTKLLPTSTLGTLAIDGTFFCFTLERPIISSGGTVPFAIPAGTYAVELIESNHFQQRVPHLLNVPEHIAIEIHPGNYPTDTKGCILVGQTQNVDYVGQSRLAFAQLMGKIQNEKDITITIS